MTTLTENSLPRRVSLPVLFSVGLHAVVIGGILYASFHQVAEVPKASQPISISLVAPEVQSEPQAVHQPAPEAVPESEPQPEPEPEPPKAEPVVIPKPQPKPRPKPKPLKKEAIKPKKELKPRLEPRQTTLFNDDKTATAAKPSTAPETSSTPAPASAAVSSGPKALHVAKPTYPARAYALRIEGRVRVQFDVDSSGQVDNIRILSAEPRNMFEREVRMAMKTWRYQSGRPGKDLTMSIVFKINGGSSIE